MRAIKKRLDERVALMADYNQQLNLNQALERMRMLEDEGLYWIEEPVRHSDYEAYARIRAAFKTPLQTGENFTSIFDMKKAIAMQSLDYVMPDVQRIGVTGWLKAAALAQAHSIDISNHMFPEYSVHLLAVAPTCHWLEYMDLASPILKQPLEIKNGFALIPDRPGVGMEWDEDAIKHFEIA